VAQEAVSAFLFDLGCRGVVLGEKGTIPLSKLTCPMTERLERLRGRTEAFLRRLREIFPEALCLLFVFQRSRRRTGASAGGVISMSSGVTERLERLFPFGNLPLRLPEA